MKLKNKKFLLFVVSILVFSLVLTACESSTPETSEEPGESVVEEPEASEPMKAALVTAQRLGDQGVTDLCHSGFVQAAEDFGYETRVLEVQKGEYEESLRALAEDGFDVIVVLYVELVDATASVAPDYPDVKFISILGEIEQPNVKGILGQEHEGSYLAGIAAAMLSETNHIGFIGGQDNAEINRFLAGFEYGALSVNPEIQLDPVYVGSFEDPTKGKDLALLLYEEGADVVYAAAAKSGLGMFEAAKETGKYCIGVDVNQNDVVPGQVIGSMTISYDKWIYDSMKEIANDEFESGVFWYGVKGDYVGYALPTEDQFDMPDEVVEAINTAKEQIISGEIQVDPVPSKDK